MSKITDPMYTSTRVEALKLAVKYKNIFSTESTIEENADKFLAYILTPESVDAPSVEITTAQSVTSNEVETPAVASTPENVASSPEAEVATAMPVELENTVAVSPAQ